MWKFHVEADQADAGWEDEQTSNEGLFVSLPLAESWELPIEGQSLTFGRHITANDIKYQEYEDK